jgi:glutathione S-transferase
VFFAGQEPQPDKVKRITEALGYLNVFLEGQDWVAGDSMTIADICLVVSVSNSEVNGLPIHVTSNFLQNRFATIDLLQTNYAATYSSCS